MSKILNVAVIGCGEVAQSIHLPNLTLASHMFKVTALCDVSQEVMEVCAKKFQVKDTYSSVTDLLSSQTPFDLVLILTIDQLHTTHVLQCAKARKHILIEKPMAQTLAEADAIEAARLEYGVVIFVGYMRRYAPALERLKEEIKGKEIKYVRVRDIIGRNKYFTSQSGMYQHYPSAPPPPSTEISNLKKANLIENLSEAQANSDPRNMHSWNLLGGLGSHDLSAMRDVIGMPKKCLMATRSDEGNGTGSWWSVLFDYGGFKCYYEMAIDEVAVFDAHIEVYTTDSRVKIQYDSPYIKGLPITLTIQSQSPTPGEHITQTIRPTYTDPYTLELQVLYKAIVEGGDYKTTPKDAKEDVELNLMIMRALVD